MAVRAERIKSKSFAGCLAAGLALLLAIPCHAGQWVGCRYDIRVTAINRAEETLTARIMRAEGAPDPGCPGGGQTITFRPETLDYQTTLPRRKWPAPGRPAHLVYRHIDGACYNEGGPAGSPCRIRHFSVH